MKDKKKVLVLASWYPSRVKLHLGTFVQRQAEAAAQYVQMSSLFVISDPEIKNEFDIESKILNDVFTVNVYYKKSKNIFRRAQRFFKAYSLGWKYILNNSGKPDIVHLNILWPAGIFAYYLKLFSGVKYIITENWTGYLDNDGTYQRSSAMKKKFTKIIAGNAEMIMPVSRDLQNAMMAHGLGSRFNVVYNVVDTSVFHPPDSSHIERQFIFLHVSTTFDDQKNVSGILKAVKMLAGKRNDFELRIVSESNFSSHKITADELNILNKFVFFESSKEAQGVADEMRKADCFILFSNYENLPVVILEAMASGLPVISSAVGGVPEHISKEFGVLVQPRDSNGLYKAMEYMMENKEKYDSKKIREYAVENFEREVVGKKIYETYRKIFEHV